MRLLVIEDDTTLRESLARRLEEQGLSLSLILHTVLYYDTVIIVIMRT